MALFQKKQKEKCYGPEIKTNHAGDDLKGILHIYVFIHWISGKAILLNRNKYKKQTFLEKKKKKSMNKKGEKWTSNEANNYFFFKKWENKRAWRDCNGYKV